MFSGFIFLCVEENKPAFDPPVFNPCVPCVEDRAPPCCCAELAWAVEPGEPSWKLVDVAASEPPVADIFFFKEILFSDTTLGFLKNSFYILEADTTLEFLKKFYFGEE